MIGSQVLMSMFKSSLELLDLVYGQGGLTAWRINLPGLYDFVSGQRGQGNAESLLPL